MSSALLSVVWAAIKLAMLVLNALQQRQLINAGQALALQSLLEISDDLVRQIGQFRSDPVSGVVVRDEFDRDTDAPASIPASDPGSTKDSSGNVV